MTYLSDSPVIDLQACRRSRPATAEAAPGRRDGHPGTVIHARFPPPASAARCPTPADRASPVLRRGQATGAVPRLMAVHADARVTSEIGELFEDLGAEVSEAVGARQALALREHGVAVDVAVIDLDLPDAQAFGLLDAMKATFGAEIAPVCVVLARREARPELIRALDLGAFDWVEKPLETALLIRVVKRAIAQADLLLTTQRLRARPCDGANG